MNTKSVAIAKIGEPNANGRIYTKEALQDLVDGFIMNGGSVVATLADGKIHQTNIMLTNMKLIDGDLVAEFQTPPTTDSKQNKHHSYGVTTQLPNNIVPNA